MRPTLLTANAITMANNATGNPVPMPNINGTKNTEPVSSARLVRLPKNNAALIGHNESAKITPSKIAPTADDAFTFLHISVACRPQENFSLIISTKTNPTSTNSGATIKFIYVCRKLAMAGIASKPDATTAPNNKYVIVRPKVYKIPAKTVLFGFCMFFDIKDIAAIFVANGHGLNDVNMPNHKADSKAKNITRPTI